jgi:cyclophilin family peptidyl-prolyl cis-trans isomerase
MWYRMMTVWMLGPGLILLAGTAGCSKSDSGTKDSTTPVSQRNGEEEERATESDAPAAVAPDKTDEDAGQEEGASQSALNDAASAPPTEPADTSASEPPAGDGPKVAMETSFGTIVLQLYPDKAPKTVENFLSYVDKGFYDGLIFHRIIPTFMIQGGGFSQEWEQKEEGLGEPIQNEADNGLKNTKGTIAMARTGDPHSATAQFFINVADNAALNHGQTQDGWGYTVFGKVIEGMDVVDKIKSVPTKTSRMKPDEESEPLDPPTIEKVERVKEQAAQ